MNKIKINLNQKIHFVGIGGIGMSGLAQIMKNMGFKIQGSDMASSKNVERCRKIGIKVFRSHKRENIYNTSILVKSSAIKSNNPEIKAAKEKKINILKRAEMLAHVVSLKTNIVVTGSHGKTTTTSLISNILSAAKFDPTIINGGIINSFNSNARLGKGNWAVLEADESDGSFLNFPINYSVVTNVDKEHMEFYKNFDNLKKSFLKFLNKTPLIGKSFVCIDDYEINKLMKKVKNRNFYTYGFSKKADFQAFNIKYKKKYSVYDLRLPIRGTKKIIVKNIKLNLIGAHNVLNSLAAVSLCLHIGIKMNVIKKSLKRFSGIQRRLTKVFQVNKREFYDDYAHHPTEIKSVLKSFKITSNERKIISVFQPHRYSRLRLLNKDFSSSFKDSDLVVLCPVYAAGEKIDRKYNPFDFAKSITKDSNVQVVLVNNQKDLNNFFKKNLIENEIIICMGAGSISKWLREMKF